MTEYAEIIKLCTVLAAHYPHAPKMGEAHFEAYHGMLRDLSADINYAAMLECIANSPDFIPPAPKIRQAAFALMAQAEGRPAAENAWAEVCKSFGPYGYYRGAPEWSHPLIGRAIDAMGGYRELCLSENAVADRAHFFKIYNALLEREERSTRMLPESRAVMQKLADSLRPQLPETVDDPHSEVG